MQLGSGRAWVSPTAADTTIPVSKHSVLVFYGWGRSAAALYKVWSVEWQRPLSPGP